MNYDVYIFENLISCLPLRSTLVEHQVSLDLTGSTGQPVYVSSLYVKGKTHFLPGVDLVDFVLQTRMKGHYVN